MQRLNANIGETHTVSANTKQAFLLRQRNSCLFSHVLVWRSYMCTDMS